MTGAIGGLGTFLRQFAAIRGDQARMAEERRRYEEQKAEEQRRYEAQQAQLEQERAINKLMTLRQFGGNVSPELAAEAEKVGMGHLTEKSPATSFVPMTPGGAPLGSTTIPETARFRQTPQEAAFGEDRERSAATRAQIEQMIASTTDPVMRQRLQLALGGINISSDELTPVAERDRRAKDLAKFEHGLRMQEIGAQMQGRETPEERYLREIDRSEMIAIADIAQRTDWPNDDTRATAIAEVRANADRLRRRIQGGQVAAASVDDATALTIIRKNFETLKKRTPNATQVAIIDQIRKDIEASPDPVERMRDKRALLQLIQELKANAAK